jgi:hypothetical protein
MRRVTMLMATVLASAIVTGLASAEQKPGATYKGSTVGAAPPMFGSSSHRTGRR